MKKNLEVVKQEGIYVDTYDVVEVTYDDSGEQCNVSGPYVLRSFENRNEIVNDCQEIIASATNSMFNPTEACLQAWGEVKRFIDKDDQEEVFEAFVECFLSNGLQVELED